MTIPILTPRAAREQQTFRALLNAMARPGTVWRLPELESAPLPLVAEALVDHEVTFAATVDAHDVTDAVLRQTGSRVATMEEADYVLCLEGGLPEALRKCKEGTPEYPDESATVICEVTGIAETEGAGDALVLTGPGIRDETRIRVVGLTLEAEVAFREKNAAPPLGADVVLVSRDGRVVCLSRYTKLQVEG